MSWETPAERVAEELRETFAEAGRVFIDPAWLGDVLRDNPPLRETPPANLAPSDVERLLAGGLVEEVARSEIRAWVRVFSVLEAHKGRWRFIAEPRLNDLLLHPGTSTF